MAQYSSLDLALKNTTSLKKKKKKPLLLAVSKTWIQKPQKYNDVQLLNIAKMYPRHMGQFQEFQKWFMNGLSYN